MGNTKLLDLMGGKDPMTISPLHVAPAWGVGSPYVWQAALDDPPVSPSNRTFFPAAVARVGRSTDPDWGDRERTTLHFPTPVPVPRLTVAGLLKADSYREPKPPAFIPHSITSHSARPSAEDREAERIEYERKKAEWDSAAAERLELIRQRLGEEAALHRRWTEGAAIHVEGVASLHRAFDTLARAILDFKVSAFFRSVEGGKLNPLEPSILTRKGVSVGLIRKGEYAADDGKLYHLFVDSDELAEAFPVPATPDIDLGRVTVDQLSPYLQLAIHLAIKHGVDAGYRDKKVNLLQAIEAEMSAFGLDGDALGRTGRDYLATFIRWPNAKKGRAERP